MRAEGGRGTAFLKTKCHTFERCFIFLNPYSFAEGVYSDGIFLLDESVGEFCVLELHQERAGFVLDLFS